MTVRGMLPERLRDVAAVWLQMTSCALAHQVGEAGHAAVHGSSEWARAYSLYWDVYHSQAHYERGRLVLLSRLVSGGAAWAS